MMRNRLGRMPAALFWVVLVSIAALHLAERPGLAAEDGLAIGAKVLPRRPGIELRVGGRNVGHAVASQMLTVTQESGDWLWIGRGWILRQDVVAAEEAVSFFTDQVQHEPSAFAYASRSRAWFQTEHFAEAMADAEKALELEPQSAVALKCRGRIKLATGDLQSAIDDLSTALKIDPELATAYNYRGQAHLKAGAYEEAIRDATAAIDRDPSITVAYSTRGRALSAVSSYERAVRDFSTLLALDPGYLPAINNRGNALFKLARYAECIRDYTAALAIEQRADVFYNRGIARINLGQLQPAIDDLTAAIKLDPEAPLPITTARNSTGSLVRRPRPRRTWPSATVCASNGRTACRAKGNVRRRPASKTRQGRRLRRSAAVGVLVVNVGGRQPERKDRRARVEIRRRSGSGRTRMAALPPAKAQAWSPAPSAFPAGQSTCATGRSGPVGVLIPPRHWRRKSLCRWLPRCGRLPADQPLPPGCRAARP